MSFISIKKQQPERGKDIIGIDEDGNKFNCFKCDCKDTDCNIWRCSISGCDLCINIVLWKYVE